jgi:hypothetical protein
MNLVKNPMDADVEKLENMYKKWNEFFSSKQPFRNVTQWIEWMNKQTKDMKDILINQAQMLQTKASELAALDADIRALNQTKIGLDAQVMALRRQMERIIKSLEDISPFLN